MKPTISVLSIAVTAAVVLIANAPPTNAYDLIKSGDQGRTIAYKIKCSDGKEHWLHQRKSDGQWCQNAGVEICFPSVDALIRAQAPSCK